MRDHDRRRPVQFEGSIEPGSVKVYSHELHSHLLGGGNVEERTIRLFDYQDLHWHLYTLKGAG